MSVFQTASVKIRDLLGITADGQATMAASLPVAIASDQSAVKVADGGGSLTVDGSVAVTDGGGSLTVDGTVAVSNNLLTDTQLRATPVPISGALTDAELRATPIDTEFERRHFSFATRGAAYYTPQAPDDLLTYSISSTFMSIYDVHIGRTLLEYDDMLRYTTTLIEMQPFFYGGDAAFDDSKIYIVIPVAIVGVRNLSVAAYSMLLDGVTSVDLDINVYAAVNTLMFDDSKGFGVTGENLGITLGSFAVDGGGQGNGAYYQNIPSAYAIISIKPSANPDGGYWAISISLSE